MTTVNFNTKISALIKANPKSIDTIAALAKPLEKLKNPILRKIMASRVTIAEAAKIGGCKTDDFKKALEPLGFQFEATVVEENTKEQKSIPDWLTAAKSEAIEYFDVRQIIESGADPLKQILHHFKEIPGGNVLCIINSFIPTPLIHLLKKEKAEDCFVKEISSNEYHAYFLKKEKVSQVAAGSNNVIMDDAAAFETIRKSFGEKIEETDVRAMEMPGPMQTILERLQTLPIGYALYIHHKRIPVYLLEELSDKNWQIHIHTIEEGNIKMLIFNKR